MKRTLDEVLAMWPKGSQYVVPVVITVDTKTKKEAATEIQKLFDGSQAVAGRFQVDTVHHGFIKKSYKVRFFRDVCDDFDVVLEKLKTCQRAEFYRVLAHQLQKELRKSIKSHKLKMGVVVCLPIKFKK